MGKHIQLSHCVKHNIIYSYFKINNQLTVGLPKRFDYLIVYHEQYSTDQNRGQYRPWDEMKMRSEEHNGQKY